RPVQWPPAGEGPRAQNRRSAIAEAKVTAYEHRRARPKDLGNYPQLGPSVVIDRGSAGAAFARVLVPLEAGGPNPDLVRVAPFPPCARDRTIPPMGGTGWRPGQETAGLGQ